MHPQKHAVDIILSCMTYSDMLESEDHAFGWDEFSKVGAE